MLSFRSVGFECSILFQIIIKKSVKYFLLKAALRKYLTLTCTKIWTKMIVSKNNNGQEFVGGISFNIS